MALEIEGKLIRKLGVQRGVSARGNWAKQEFIVEFQEGNFPAQACLNVWGEDKVKDLERYHEGDSLRISFHVSSREFNGKWYTDLRAWRIDPVGEGSGYGQGNASYGGQNASGGRSRGQSYGSQPGWNAGPQAPAPTPDDFTTSLGDDDDLPF